MYGKVQESGLTETILLMRALASRGQNPVLSQPWVPSGCTVGGGCSSWPLDGGHPVSILSSLGAPGRVAVEMAWWLQHPLFSDVAGNIFHSQFSPWLHSSAWAESVTCLVISPTSFLVWLAPTTLATPVLWMCQACSWLRAFALVPSAWIAFPPGIRMTCSFLTLLGLCSNVLSRHNLSKSTSVPYRPLSSPFSLALPDKGHIYLKRARTLPILFPVTSLSA